MRNAFVTNEQAGSDFYLRRVNFPMYYIKELGTVLVNAYLTNETKLGSLAGGSNMNSSCPYINFFCI